MKEKIKKFILDNSKFNLINIVVFLITLFFSWTLVYGSNVHFIDIYQSSGKNYIDDMSFIQYILVIILGIIIYYLVNLVSNLYKKVDKYFYEKKEITNKYSIIKKCLILFLIINVLWLPYYLTYYPGAIFSDTLASINQVSEHWINNHHTLLYTCFLGIFVKIGESINSFNKAFMIYTLIQAFIMSFIISYFIVWLEKYNFKMIIRVVIFLFMGLCPLYPYYAIITWKDTLFSLALFVYVLFLIDFSFKKIDLSKNKNIIILLIIMFFVSYLRNNGLYIIIFTLIYFIICYYKDLSNYKKFIISNIIFIVISIIIRGPIYNHFNLHEENVESLAVPLQSIGAVIVNNGDYDYDYASRVWNVSEIKAKYTPCLADSMKWYLQKFDFDYFDDNLNLLYKNFFYVVIHNPKIVFKEFMLNNLGFWHLKYQDSYSYVHNYVWKNDVNLYQVNYFKKIFGFDFDKIAYPKIFISSAVFFFIIILSMVISLINNKSFKLIISYIPVVGLWITIMIATPVAMSLRYVYLFVLVLPLSIILPSIKLEEVKVKKNKKKNR